MATARRMAIIGFIAFVAALAGVFVGRLLVDAPRQSETELHALLHRSRATRRPARPCTAN